MIKKSFTAMLAAAVAVSTMTAQPAMADRENLAKIVTGLAAIGIIGAAIATSKSDRGHVTRGQPRYRSNGHVQPEYNNHYVKPAPKRVNRKALPRGCRVSAQTHYGLMRGYSKHCLNRNYNHVHSLPNDCAYKARGSQGYYDRVLYQGSCLRKYGYHPRG